MALEIKIPEDELAFEMRVELESAFYILRFRFNGRADCWIMDLLDGDGNNVALGIIITSNIPLTSAYKNYPGAPPGFIVCLDMQGEGDLPKQDELGTRYKLIYYTSEEVAALG